MTACAELSQKYLWADRLCIIQDDDWMSKSVELDQMATIYGQALLTIVAAEGDSADYGLVGVSRARDSRATYRFSNNLNLLEGVPPLSRTLDATKWAQRDWTFQEYLVSNELIYFTRNGLYVGRKHFDGNGEYAEGPVKLVIIGAYDGGMTYNLLETFTRKILTYPIDILRAISGVLYAIYGREVSYGMPWCGFDHFMAWTPQHSNEASREPGHSEEGTHDIFPTWSWTSAVGSISFGDQYRTLYSLAYYGVPVNDDAELEWYEKRWMPIGCTASSGVLNLATAKLAALAWMSNCVRSPAPELLQFNCRGWEYDERLKDIWPEGAESYWNQAFDGYNSSEHFNDIKIGKGIAGCLAVYLQTVMLVLDHGSRDKADAGNLIRTLPGMGPVGAARIDRSPSPGSGTWDPSRVFVTCVALSVGDLSTFDFQDSLEAHLQKLEGSPSPSSFFGCPCSQSSCKDPVQRHVVGCTKHMDFPKPLSADHEHMIPTQSETEIMNKSLYRAYGKHLLSGRYDDGERSPYGFRLCPPTLNVLLVAPASGQKLLPRPSMRDWASDRST